MHALERVIGFNSLFAILVAQDRFIFTTAFASRGPKTSSWFAGFNKAESTYDADGVTGNMAGSTVVSKISTASDVFGKNARKFDFFHESKGQHSDVAWQTHYPKLSSGNEWMVSGDTIWSQTYNDADFGLLSKHWDAHFKSDGLDGDFFDTALDQLDAYARTRTPNKANFADRSELLSEIQHGKLACKNPGCSAETTLSFERKQTADACFLNVSFVVTDFDRGGQHDPEMVSFVKVNNRVVAGRCTPLASGCNSKDQERRRFACANNLEITRLQNSSGFVVEAAITEAVDECAYEGNLLSGIASVTCYYPKNHTNISDPTVFMESKFNQDTMNHAILTKVAFNNRNLKTRVRMFENLLGPTMGNINSAAELKALFRSFYVASVFPMHLPINSDSPSEYAHIAAAKLQFPDIDFYLNQIETLDIAITLNDTDFDDMVEQNIVVTMDNHTFKADETPISNPCHDQADAFSFVYTQRELSKLVNRTETLIWRRNFTGDEIAEYVRASQKSGVSLTVSKFVDDCPNNGHYVDGRVDISVALKPDDNVNSTFLAELLHAAHLSWPYGRTGIS